MPKVTVNDTKVAVLQSSYCWIGKCVDMISPGELLKHHNYKAVKVSPGDRVHISFDAKPKDGTLSVQYEKDQKHEKVPFEGNAFSIPDEKGTHIYMVSANWSQGSSSYIFSVEAGEK